jgi:hypothetical protein
MARSYKIKKGLLKGVGLKRRHIRLLRKELKKTVGSYIGSGTVYVAAKAAGAAVRSLRDRPKPKALPKHEE